MIISNSQRLNGFGLLGCGLVGYSRFLVPMSPHAILSQSSISPYKGNYRSGDLDNGLCLFITAGVDKPGHMVGNSDCIRAKAITSLMSFSLWWPIPDGTLKMEWFSLSDF